MKKLKILLLAGFLAAWGIFLPQSALASPISVKDGGGSNDVTQDQSDITALTIDYANVATGQIKLNLQLDPVANSGNNTSDISVLFDTDGDGNANCSYVISLGNNPFTVTAVALQCGNNDSSTIKIAGSTTSLGIGTTAWTVGLGTNPFTGDQDTLVSMNLDIAVIAAARGVPVGSVKLVNMTTIPSSSATSDPKDVLLSSLAPFATNDTATVVAGAATTVAVLANDSDKLGFNTVQITAQPASGAVTVNPDGTVTYTSSGTYTGPVTFSYSAIGIDGQTYTATVTITVTGIAAVNDSATGINGFIGQATVLNAFTGDTVNGATANATNSSLTVAAGSTVPSGLIFNTSTGNVGVSAGTPAGTYSFDYRICQISAPSSCDIATITITVIPYADLRITKSNGVSDVFSGSTVTYTVTVNNNGPDAITGAIVTDTVGTGLTCLGTDPVTITGSGVPAGSFTISNLTGTGIALGTLANGQTATLTYSCKVN